MLLLRRSTSRLNALHGALKGRASPLEQTRAFSSPSTIDLFHPAWLPRPPDEAPPSPPSLPKDAPVPPATALDTPPVEQPLPDDDFNCLPPLDQTRYALQQPVPTSLPLLRDPRLAALVASSESFPEGLEQDTAVDLLYHPDRLRAVGNRLWYNIVAETQFVLSPIEPVTPPAHPNLSSLQEDHSILGRKARAFGVEFGLVKKGHPSYDAGLHALESFETFVGALLYSNGRRAVLEFLVPLIKREYFRLPQQRYNALPPLGTGPIETAPLASSQVDPPAASPTVIPNSPSSVEQQLQQAPNFTPKAAKLRRMRPISPNALQYPDRHAASENYFSALSNLDIPFSFRYGARKYFLDLPGRPFPFVLVVKTDAQMKVPVVLDAIVRNAIKHGHLKVEPKALREPPLPTPHRQLDASSSATSASPASTITPEGPPSAPATDPLRFASVREAAAGLVAELKARKYPFSLVCKRHTYLLNVARWGKTFTANFDTARRGHVRLIPLVLLLQKQGFIVITASTSIGGGRSSLSASSTSTQEIQAVTPSAARKVTIAKQLALAPDFSPPKALWTSPCEAAPLAFQSAVGLEDHLLVELDRRGIPFKVEGFFNGQYRMCLPGRPSLVSSCRGRGFQHLVALLVFRGLIQILDPFEAACYDRLRKHRQVAKAPSFSPTAVKLAAMHRAPPVAFPSLEAAERDLFHELDRRDVPFWTYSQTLPHRKIRLYLAGFSESFITGDNGERDEMVRQLETAGAVQTLHPTTDSPPYPPPTPEPAVSSPSPSPPSSAPPSPSEAVTEETASPTPALVKPAHPPAPPPSSPSPVSSRSPSFNRSRSFTRTTDYFDLIEELHREASTSASPGSVGEAEATTAGGEEEQLTGELGNGGPAHFLDELEEMMKEGMEEGIGGEGVEEETVVEQGEERRGGAG